MSSAAADRVLALASVAAGTELDLDVDLIGSGIFDSLAFLELVAMLEGEFRVELDFAELDPERFTTPRGLGEAIEASLAGQAGAPQGSRG